MMEKIGVRYGNSRIAEVSFYVVSVCLMIMLLCSPKAMAMGSKIPVKDLNADRAEVQKKIPVILDTDIGDDVDDTWALVFLLKCPELDVKLITTCTGDTELRAKMVAKVLEMSGRTDIPIGIGLPTGRDDIHKYYQRTFIDGYDLSAYSGTIYQDGIGSMIDTIMESDQPVRILAIGPLTNLAEAIKRQPLIANKSEVIGMQGAVRVGYHGSTKVVPEWNVRTYIEPAQKVFTSQWPILITPLDTCGTIRLKGDLYRKVYESNSPYAKAVIESYRAWMARPGFKPDTRWDVEENSSVLYDTLAVYLAFTTELVKVENLGIAVDDKGKTKIEENAKKIDCATYWQSDIAQGQFEKMLVARITDM